LNSKIVSDFLLLVLNSKLVIERHGLKPTRLFDVNVSNTTKQKKIDEIVVIKEPKVAI